MLQEKIKKKSLFCKAYFANDSFKDVLLRSAQTWFCKRNAQQCNGKKTSLLWQFLPMCPQKWKVASTESVLQPCNCCKNATKKLTEYLLFNCKSTIFVPLHSYIFNEMHFTKRAEKIFIQQEIYSHQPNTTPSSPIRRCSEKRGQGRKASYQSPEHKSCAAACCRGFIAYMGGA